MLRVRRWYCRLQLRLFCSLHLAQQRRKWGLKEKHHKQGEICTRTQDSPDFACLGIGHQDRPHTKHQPRQNTNRSLRYNSLNCCPLRISLYLPDRRCLFQQHLFPTQKLTIFDVSQKTAQQLTICDVPQTASSIDCIRYIQTMCISLSILPRL